MVKNTKKRSGSKTAILIARIVLRIVVIVLAAGLLITGAKKAFHFGYSVFTFAAMEEAPGEDVMVTISPEMTNAQIGELLESHGLISDSLIFEIQSKIYKYKTYPGDYVLNTSQTLEEMIAIMSVEPESESDDGVIPTQAESVIPTSAETEGEE